MSNHPAGSNGENSNEMSDAEIDRDEERLKLELEGIAEVMLDRSAGDINLCIDALAAVRNWRESQKARNFPLENPTGLISIRSTPTDKGA